MSIVQAADIRPVLEAAVIFTTSNGTFSNLFIQGGRVMATDGLTLFIGAVPGMPDSVLSVKDVMHFFRNLPVGAIEIEEKDTTLRCKSGRFRQVLQKVHALNIPSADLLFNTSFQAIQASENIASVAMTPSILQMYAQMGLYAVPEQDREYVALQGVQYVQGKAYAATKFCAAGMDVRSLPEFAGYPDFRMPSKLCRFLAGQTECPKLYLKREYIWLVYPSWQLITQRTAIQYPEAVMTLVDNFTSHFTYNLLAEESYKKETARRLLIGESGALPITISIKGNEMHMQTRTPENTREAHDSLPVGGDFYQDLPFSFNAAYQFFSKALLKTTVLEIMRESGNDVMVAMHQEVGPTLYLRSKILRGVE